MKLLTPIRIASLLLLVALVLLLISKNPTVTSLSNGVVRNEQSCVPYHSPRRPYPPDDNPHTASGTLAGEEFLTTSALIRSKGNSFATLTLFDGKPRVDT